MIQLKAPFKSKTRITSLYGQRTAPVAGASTQHKGVDFVISDKVVCASGDGVIRSVNLDANKDSAGLYVTIKHADGTITKYFHLESTNWRVGQQVKQGEQIGVMGNTGIGSGAHLHFEVWVNYIHVEPTQYIGIENRIGPTIEKRIVPEWERLVRSKMDNADDWVVNVNERIAYGKSTNTIEKNLDQFIIKLTKDN